MNKTLLVLRYEIGTVLRSKSFLFTAFGLPLIGVLIFAGVSLARAGGEDSAVDSSTTTDTPELQVEGYVDEANLIQHPSAEIPPDILLLFPDRESALAALNAGEIAAYYIIPADYLEQGDLLYINPEYRPMTSDEQSWVMRRTIFANLLNNDPGRLERATQVMDLQMTPVKAEAVERAEDHPAAFYVPYGTMMAFYMVIIMSASLLLNSVSNEKKNRTIEVLLLSASPQELLTGKIIGLGLLGLLQMAIWLGTGYTVLRLSGRTLSLPPGFELPPSILAWGVTYFMLGYGVYASLMAGLGALVPNLKEASQAVIVVIWPMLIPMLFVVALIENQAGALAVGLSLFPLTAPIAMMVRLAVANVPVWQLAVSVVLLAATAALIVRAVGRMFHAQTLLSGQPFSGRRFFLAFLGRT